MIKKRIKYIKNDSFRDCTIMDDYNCNIGNPFLNDYTTVFEYDENDNLIKYDSNKYDYDNDNRLIKIISRFSDSENFGHITIYETDFEHFDNSVLVKKRKKSSESFLSSNGISYTSDGENVIVSDLKTENSIIESYLINLEDIKKFIPQKVKFYNENDKVKNNNIFKNESETEILEQDTYRIRTKKVYPTEFKNEITELKEYIKHFETGVFLLSSSSNKVTYKEGAEYYTNYDDKGNIINENLENPNFDYEAHYFEENKYLGTEYYNYDESGNLTYIENEICIVLITIEIHNNIKTEKELIIDKRKKNFSEGYSIILEEFK